MCMIVECGLELYNEVSLYRGSFPYILPLLGPGKSFVMPRTSLHRGLLNPGSTVLDFKKTINGLILFALLCLSFLNNKLTFILVTCMLFFRL